MMRWFFREDDIANDDPPGLRKLFELMRPHLDA
jgi:hypothetical protein